MNDEIEIVNEISHDAVDASMLPLIQRAEIDTQIATAKKYPRSIRQFMDNTRQMVTLSEDVAAECMYALPRGGKSIEGPSARFAEVIASAWGNCRAGARVVATDDKFVTAQGAFHDLEQNVAITYEVRRRITDKNGKRFNDDMITVTGNAASSIALRNAVLKGVPKAFWKSMYDEARKCAIGDIQTLPTKRANMLSAFGKMGVTDKMIFSVIQVKGIEDIQLDQLATLRGLYQAIKDGETTIEMAFETSPAGSKVQESSLKDKLNGAKEASYREAIAAAKLQAELTAVSNEIDAALNAKSITQELYSELENLIAARWSSLK